MKRVYPSPVGQLTPLDWFQRARPNLAATVSRDLDHGRAEKRVVMVSDQLSLLDAAEGWTGLKSVVCVESTRWLNGKEQQTKRYYITGSPVRLLIWMLSRENGTLYPTTLEY